MAQVLPFTNAPAQSFTVQLGEDKVFIEARWNSRNNRWSFDLYDDATREPYFIGQPIVLGQDFLDPYNFPLGALVAIDETGQGREADADTLGTSVNVYWIAPDEVV